MSLHAVQSWPQGTAPERPVVVLIHGFGANEEHMAGLGRALAGVLDLDWVALRAPVQIAPEGYAWFPITTPGNPATESVESAAAAVHAWVLASVPVDVAVLGVGFSQGGTVVSHLIRTRFDRWRSAALLGSFVLPGIWPDDEAIRADQAPVFSGRGEVDQVIAADAVQRTDAWLDTLVNPTRHAYPGLAHAINNDEASDLARWIGETFARPHDAL